MMNLSQNSFFEIIDKSLVGLKRLNFITESTRDKILNILQEEIKWDNAENTKSELNSQDGDVTEPISKAKEMQTIEGRPDEIQNEINKDYEEQ